MWVVVRGWMTPRIALRLRNRAIRARVSEGLDGQVPNENEGLVMSIKLTESAAFCLSAAQVHDRCLVLPST